MQCSIHYYTIYAHESVDGSLKHEIKEMLMKAKVPNDLKTMIGDGMSKFILAEDLNTMFGGDVSMFGARGEAVQRIMKRHGIENGGQLNEYIRTQEFPEFLKLLKEIEEEIKTVKHEQSEQAEDPALLRIAIKEIQLDLRYEGTVEFLEQTDEPFKFSITAPIAKGEKIVSSTRSAEEANEAYRDLCAWEITTDAAERLPEGFMEKLHEWFFEPILMAIGLLIDRKKKGEGHEHVFTIPLLCAEEMGQFQNSDDLMRHVFALNT